MTYQLTPELVSEATSRLLKNAPPQLLQTLQQPTLTHLSGHKLERLLIAAWLTGYADGIEDAQHIANGDETPILTWYTNNKP